MVHSRRTSSKRFAALRERAIDLLHHNRRQKAGYQYTVPSPETYPYQWLWDSCFHAIVLRHIEPEAAKKELRSAVSQQFDNGLLPHMIYWEKSDRIDITWGREWRERTSTITQPPLIAEAVWSVYEKDGDAAFLQELYPALRSYYQYLLTARDPRNNHLAGIINPDESGEDNSPRFDSVLGLPPIQSLAENFKSRLKLVQDFREGNFDAPFMKQYFWVKDVPFNAILAKNLRILASFPPEIVSEEEAARYEKAAQDVEAAMRERMLDDGVFWSTYGETYSKIRLKSWAMFAPLYAGFLSNEEAQTLVDSHLLNVKEFASKFMLPTVSMDEESYDAAGFWRGPVWIATNWFVFRGLMRYKRADVAEMILESSAALLETSGFREYFNPATGEGYGADHFTWGALIIDMLAEAEKYKM